MGARQLTAAGRPRRLGEVSRLTWIEQDHGWRAGPYEIELAAPHLWVCTRRLRGGAVRVEATSGSLSALKTRVERRDHRRRSLRKGLIYLAVFLLSVAIMVGAVVAESSLAPLVLVVFSSLGLFAALKSVDCVISRSWESLRLHYQ